MVLYPSVRKNNQIITIRHSKQASWIEGKKEIFLHSPLVSKNCWQPTKRKRSLQVFGAEFATCSKRHCWRVSFILSIFPIDFCPSFSSLFPFFSSPDVKKSLATTQASIITTKLVDKTKVKRETRLANQRRNSTLAALLNRCLYINIYVCKNKDISWVEESASGNIYQRAAPAKWKGLSIPFSPVSVSTDCTVCINEEEEGKKKRSGALLNGAAERNDDAAVATPPTPPPSDI